MNSPIHHPIYNGICPGAPTKKRPLTVCLIRQETKINLFPDTKKDNVRSTTPPPRGKPNKICYCDLDKCTCCYAPKRVKKSNN